MLVHGSFHRVRENFAAQFEPIGDQFLYRKRIKGAPIRVSAEERESFIAAFDRFLRIAMWSLIVGAFVFGIALAAVQANVGFSDAINDDAVWGFMVLVVVVFMVLYVRAYAAPSRALRDRYPEGGERSREEVQRHNFKRLSYRQLILPLLLVVALWGLAIWRGDPLSGENLLWFGVTVVSMMVVLFVLYRKWRFETAEK